MAGKGIAPSPPFVIMGKIRQIDGVYYIEFYARGLMYSQVAGGDLKVAEALLRKTETAIASGEALTIVREIDLPAFYAQFLQDSRTQYHTHSIKRFQATISHFDKFIKSGFPQVLKLSQINPQLIELYRIALIKSAKPKLVNLTLLLLREILEYGIKIGFIHDNPTLHLHLLPMEAKACAPTRRYQLARDLFAKGLTIGRVCQLLEISDVARLMYYAKLIPLSREDMYN